ncbi:MAG: AI-2E family transporter, partial [Patescibacteria group bacterium]|nr:AI-2E family transporter [Patescibacteria group bacterium]
MNHSSIKKLQKIILFTVFLTAVGLLFWMFKPYLFSLFWACVLASLFHPFYKAILAKTKNRNASALVTLLIVL